MRSTLAVKNGLLERAHLPIVRVDIFAVKIPLHDGGFSNAYGTMTSQTSIVVRLTSQRGVSGLGNIDPFPGYSETPFERTLKVLRRTLAPAILHCNAANPHMLADHMNSVLAGFAEAKAAVEMASIDLTARTLGISMHAYLGGALRHTMNLNGWIGMVSPDTAAREGARWREQGYKSLKIKVGGGVSADVERVRAVREACGGDMKLRADANAAYRVEESIALGRALETFDLQLLEQPVSAIDLEGLARVRQAIGIPIMADEAITDHPSLIRLIRADCADLIKVKVMKQGGMLLTQRMIETAAAAGLGVVIGHGFGLSISTAAEIALAATSRSILDGLECVGPLKLQDDVVQERLNLQSGVITLGTGFGLGLTLDESKIERYRIAEEA